MRPIPIALLAAMVLFAGCIMTPAPVGDDGTPDEPSGPGPLEWGDPADAVLYPGAPIGWCTYNFVFVDPDGEANVAYLEEAVDVDGDANATDADAEANETALTGPTYYIGTAAHCTDDIGQRMPLEGHGEIGVVVFDSDNETLQKEYGLEGRVDFSLIRLDEGVNKFTHPRMKNTQGPAGIATGDDVALGDELIHHGYGMVFGDLEPARDRPGYLVSYDSDYCSESVIWWGDSGSPVLHGPTNKALGIVSRAGWVECDVVSQLRGATLPYIMDELAKTPFSEVRLVDGDGEIVA